MSQGDPAPWEKPAPDPVWDDVRMFGDMAMFYDLDGAPCSMRKWTELLSTRKRVMLHGWPNGTHVSTVYLGTDLGFGGRPMIFETMVFGPDGTGEAYEHYTRRYASMEDALAGHAEVVAEVAPMVPGEPVELPDWDGRA